MAAEPTLPQPSVNEQSGTRVVREAESAQVTTEADETRLVQAYLDGPVSLVDTVRVQAAFSRYRAIVDAQIADGGLSEDEFAALYESTCPAAAERG